MGESFEAKLIAASSKEVFKKAKQIVRGGHVLCCHESTPGVLRAICRDSHGFLSRAELRGFPNGPFTGTCSCEQEFRGFCPHAMAAALYHAKYTIKYRGEEAAQDTPAQYQGLKFSGMPELLNDMLSPRDAWVEINAESEFPHVPSKWERVPLDVKLRWGKREYFGNLNNLRNLHFNKNLTASLQLSYFSLQDRQIIRYLAINAQQDGTRLQLDSEQFAEFFQCLAGFQNFKSLGEKVVIHRAPATPVFLLEKVRDGGYVLKPAIIVRGAPLPLADVKVVTGRSGCWVGMLGEYWWIPAQTDVAWLRNFLRTTVQPCDKSAVQALLARKDMPVRIVPMNNVRVQQQSFKTLYDAVLKPDGSLELEMMFDYAHMLCPADKSRLTAHDGKFLRRDTKGEFEAMRELLNFGFELREDRTNAKSPLRFVLTEKEAIGMFVDELVPRWLREKRDCLLSSALAALCGDSGRLQISTKVVASDDTSFDVAVSLNSAGMPVRWRDLAAVAANNEFFLTAHGTLVKIPPQLRLLAANIQSVIQQMAEDPAYPETDILRIPRLAALYWAETGAAIPGAVPFEFLRLKVDMDSLAQDMENPADVTDHAVFTGELRPYQQAGVYWLRAMGERACNPILADEMGLGKTIQTIGLLSSDTQKNLPALVIAPTSLVDNWAREVARFAPSLRTVKIEGPQRDALWKKAHAADICICSYALAKRDSAKLTELHFKYLVLDEAQHIKNPASINAQTCKMISAEHKIVLTGTPLENSAEDLWSIFDFLHPGLLGSLRAFRAKYADISRNHEIGRELSRAIAPFILRRKKADVCQELPPKQEQELYCEMDSAQLKLYREYEEQALSRVRELRNNSKGDGNRMELLTALLRLRQICCDPALLENNDGKPVRSAKMELLQEVLRESLDSGHKVLVFSQFTSMLKIIRQWLESENIPCEYLDGATKDRMARVDEFNQNPDLKVFLLSLKAGGVGLNLTGADTVILYDPWWNPSAEAQAMDRSHRIGQKNSVNCMKLYVRGSIEEKVFELQKRKQELFGMLVEDSAAAMGGMTLDDFEFLLSSNARG